MTVGSGRNAAPSWRRYAAVHCRVPITTALMLAPPSRCRGTRRPVCCAHASPAAPRRPVVNDFTAAKHDHPSQTAPPRPCCAEAATSRNPTGHESAPAANACGRPRPDRAMRWARPAAKVPANSAAICQADPCTLASRKIGVRSVCHFAEVELGDQLRQCAGVHRQRHRVQRTRRFSTTDSRLGRST